tara:strand:- start:11 stop:328 length:318 start_codon:yes stop_codon:yes gene_type:complete
MGIFGAALRGFGMLGKKGVKPKTRLDTFKKASKKSKKIQKSKRIQRELKETLDSVSEASKRAAVFSRFFEPKKTSTKKDFMKQPYSKSKINKYLTAEYKKQQRKP